MHATEVIETFIDDTVRLLPRRERNDVATELRSLLSEELHARAQQSGRPPDESLALSLVRGYGRPNEVAARYHRPWAIIDPADSTNFMRAALIGSGALLLLGAISKRPPSLTETADNLVKIGIPVWLGILVLAFGAKNWIRRRWPGRRFGNPATVTGQTASQRRWSSRSPRSSSSCTAHRAGCSTTFRAAASIRRGQPTRPTSSGCASPASSD